MNSTASPHCGSFEPRKDSNMSTARIKIDRPLKALNHEESDRVPVGEFFCTNFIRRCKAELDVGPVAETRRNG